MDDVVPSALQRLRASDIIRMAGLAAASLGQEYCHLGAVQATTRRGAQLYGSVDLSHWGHSTGVTQANTEAVEHAPPEIQRYHVDVEIASSTSWQAHCSCSSPMAAICRHVAALLYTWLARPEAFQSVLAQSAPDELPGASPAPGLAADMPPRQAGYVVTLRGPTPSNNLMDILTQMGLSELRAIAREYDIVTTGLSKQSLAEAIVNVLRQPEVIRKVAATLEKPQRQLLATLALAGGSMSDDDLHGMFERFSFGPAEQLRHILLVLQGKGLLFHTSLNSAPLQRIGLSGSLYDVGWSIPAEVRAALHVPVPITPFQIQQGAELAMPGSPVLQHREPYRLLADLLLVGRALDGYQLAGEDQKTELQPGGNSRTPDHFSTVRVPPALTNDGASSIAPPHGLPSAAFIEKLQNILPHSPAFPRYALRLLRLADILHKNDGGTPYLRLLGNAAELLLGPGSAEIARDLFELWLTQAAYDELYELQDEGLCLHCRTTPLNHPLLRPGELEAENREARQALVALIAQAPLNQWISFPAFARFIYRLNPFFLQKRQRLFPSPHWWLEQEEGRPLQPTQINDWMHAEGHYLTRLIREPLHWWGISDLALSDEGRLLAFRLTPLAGLLLANIAPAQPSASHDQASAVEHLAVRENGELLVACSAAAWPLIDLLEKFTECAGMHDNRLCYRLTPASLTTALRNGRQPVHMLQVLQRFARHETQAASGPLHRLLAQIERWLGSYGHVRMYTGISLLEVADAQVMRELVATTSVEEQLVQAITPTRMILKKQGTERMIEELKRRGRVPLLHERPYYGAE